MAAGQRPLIEGPHPNFTAIITNPENWAKISRVHFQEIELERILKTGSSFGS